MVRIPVHPKHGWRLPKPVYEALVADARDHDPAGVADTIELTIPTISQRDRLSENSRPACLIWGKKEKRFTEMAEFARSNMPLLTTAELNAGHGMNMEDAPGFNEAVLGFLSRCAADARQAG